MAEQVDIREIADKSDFQELPKVGFAERASLWIATWILATFAGVLLLAHVFLGLLIYKHWDLKEGELFDKVADLVKYLVQSVVPLVTLAVGYYLGDRNRSGRN